MTYYSPTHPPTHSQQLLPRPQTYPQGIWASLKVPGEAPLRTPSSTASHSGRIILCCHQINVLPTHCIVPYIHTSFIFPFDFPQSSSSIVAPATITFCLSGGTPAMFCATLYHCMLIVSCHQTRFCNRGLRLNHSLCLSMNVVLHDHTTTYLIGTNRFN